MCRMPVRVLHFWAIFNFKLAGAIFRMEIRAANSIDF